MMLMNIYDYLRYSLKFYLKHAKFSGLLFYYCLHIKENDFNSIMVLSTLNLTKNKTANK